MHIGEFGGYHGSQVFHVLVLVEMPTPIMLLSRHAVVKVGEDLLVNACTFFLHVVCVTATIW